MGAYTEIWKPGGGGAIDTISISRELLRSDSIRTLRIQPGFKPIRPVVAITTPAKAAMDLRRGSAAQPSNLRRDGYKSAMPTSWTTSAFARFGVRLLVAAGLVSSLGGFASIEALFAPKAELWERWTSHEPQSTSIVDHTAWDRILKTYLIRDDNGVQRFAYGTMAESDKSSLDTYIETLAAIPVSQHNRAEQMAFWINLYNALTVQVVLAAYPVESIRDISISPGLFARGPWGKKLISVEGEAVSLNDIEHRILRPIWRDPRIHYAVNCASVGCPNLQRDAFTSANTEQLLEEAARDYVNHPRGVRIEDEGLTVSSLYVWFAEDFGDSDMDVIAHLRRYAEAELAATLSGITAIGGMAYDWALNDAPGS